VSADVTAVRVLAFHSGSERYLVHLDAIRAVVRLRGLRRLPGSGGALAGVLDVQDTSVAIYDTRGLQQTGEPGDVDARGDVLVLATGWPDHAIGVACDSVEGLLELPADTALTTTSRPPHLPSYVEALLRIDGTTVPLVDVVGLAEATALAAASSATERA
jgi:chemotaxis signal transduction protein